MRYMKARLELEHAEEEIRTLESRIQQLKEAKVKLGDEIREFEGEFREV